MRRNGLACSLARDLLEPLIASGLSEEEASTEILDGWRALLEEAFDYLATKIRSELEVAADCGESPLADELMNQLAVLQEVREVISVGSCR